MFDVLDHRRPHSERCRANSGLLTLSRSRRATFMSFGCVPCPRCRNRTQRRKLAPRFPAFTANVCHVSNRRQPEVRLLFVHTTVSPHDRSTHASPLPLGSASVHYDATRISQCGLRSSRRKYANVIVASTSRLTKHLEAVRSEPSQSPERR